MIILASKSPRRRQLLSMMGLDFTVRTADIDETMDPSQTPAHEVAAVSARKAAKIAAMHPDDVIVSADTIVVIDGKILGKPKDEEDAARMLRMLSGRTHTVYTGLTVHADGESKTQVVGTDVTFRELTDAEIAAYIKRRSPWTRRVLTAFRATARCLSRIWMETISA
ncbi:MAG: Maf family protein [Oscillospiraceae bacterium]